MTQPDDDTVRRIAREMVLDAIADEYHYKDHLAEQLEDYEVQPVDFEPPADRVETWNGVPEALIERLREELYAIRDQLAESWGMDA